MFSDGEIEHEQVVFCFDRESGLKAIIAVYSTALGPALGGTRFHPYPDLNEAAADALALAQAMAYKAACAGLDFGGGKAVIVGEPGRDKNEEMLRAYGRFIASLGGRYITACDVGTHAADMDVVARECTFVTGRSPAFGGSGDSGPLTAFGVLQGMHAAAQHRWGTPDLRGKRVAVLGLGKVGRPLVDHLVAEGAVVTGADVAPARVAAVRAAHPHVREASPEEIAALPVDIFAPCALGGALDDGTVEALQAEIVCGGANNQLAGPKSGEHLASRGVLYAPDYVVNAGGLIQVADEYHGWAPARARARCEGIFDTTLRVLRLADTEGVPPGIAADRLAERRMQRVGRLRAILLPGTVPHPSGRL
ncbi:MAG: Leu/Phe/Val dehydrogenase [Frankiaceae bacterium]